MIEKKICQNPHHPFKQKWYNYGPPMSNDTIDYLRSDKYCVSCASYLHSLKIMLMAISQPRETLYGYRTIGTSPEQIHELVKEVYGDIHD